MSADLPAGYTDPRSAPPEAPEPPMPPRRRLRLVVAVVAVALLASAVAAVAVLRPWDPTAAPEPTPTRAPTSAAPNPSPSATVPALAEPLSVLALECGELLSTATVADLLGVEGSTVSAGRLPMSNGTAAMRQAGVLQCSWSAVVGDDLGERSLRVDVLPDAADLAAGYVAEQPGTFDVDGLACSEQPAGPEYGPVDPEREIHYCTLELGTDGYWVEATLSAVHLIGGSSARDEGRQLRTELVASIDAAPTARPLWTPPEDAATFGAGCADLDGAGGFAAEIGSGSMTAPELGDFASTSPTLFVEAYRRGGMISCVWRHADVFTTPPGEIRQAGLHRIVGGEWAWQRNTVEKLATGADQPWERVPIAGADDALIWCSYGTCGLELIAGGSYLTAQFSSDEMADADVRARTIAGAEFWLAQTAG